MMLRRDFIKQGALTAFGLMVGGSLFATAFERCEFKLIDIDFPIVHMRHGFYNIQGTNDKILQVQRDIFNQNGLVKIAENRFVSIKVSESRNETFGVLNKEGLRSKSNKLVAAKLNAKKTVTVIVDSPSIIFSEFEKIKVGGVLVKSHQAVFINSKQDITVHSDVNQSVFIYTIQV